MWEGLPQKLVTPKIGYPQKIGYPKKLIKKNGYPKHFGVLYYEGVYYCI